MTDTETPDVVIVGAGFAGLYQLYKARELGLRATVFEAGSGVGGTWYFNRYPGARCDVPSMSYSYSFSPELEQEWHWTEKFPTQPEILRYLEHVANRFALRDDIVFDTRVTAAHFDDTTRRWRVCTDTGRTVSTQFLVMATGCLSVPKPVDIPGVERFGGRTYHTAQWPHEEVDFTGRRVAVIGTGSSGVQLIPLVAKQAAELTVFQRTPNFTMPAGHRPLTRSEITEMKHNYRAHRVAQRSCGFGVPVPTPTQSAFEVSQTERDAVYDEKWNTGTLTGMLNAFTDLLVDKGANDTAAEYIRGKIRSIVTDPAVAEALLPRGYAYGSKRPCLGDDFYETFNADHVRLVDIHDEPIVEITECGIRTVSAEYPCEDLVFATGFDAITGALDQIDIRGVAGQSLRESWASGPRAYLGVAVSGFPNLFLITGPGSPSVLSNVVVSLEQHVEWISTLLAALRDSGNVEVEATPQAQDAWVTHVAEAADETLFPTADSWYVGANVPGKPRVFMAYVGGVDVYGAKLQEVADHHYEGLTIR